MKEQYPARRLTAVMELHTFSSLNKDFLQEYHGGMDKADTAVVFIDHEAMKLKQMPPLDPALIISSFGREDMRVFSEKEKLQEFLLAQNWHENNLLLMTSGQFGGMDVKGLAGEVISDL
jgi:UDP-N-acetylmuramate: L-alanyl-gamma-D-glutamyl-meso-diaminopimelate ligase